MADYDPFDDIESNPMKRSAATVTFEDEDPNLDDTIALSSGHFDDLPDETLLLVISYLEPKEIASLGRTCRRFYSISRDTPLWADMARRRNWSRPGQLDNTVNQSQSFYVRKYRSFKNREAESARRHQEALARQRKNDRIANVKNVFLALCLCRGWELMSLLGLIAVTILAALRFDGSFDTNVWPLIFIPLYFFVFHICCVPPLMLLIGHIFDTTLHEQFEISGLVSPFLYWFFFVYPLGYRRNTFAAFPTWWSVFSFLVLLFIKTTPYDAMPWWVVFLPLLVVCLVWIIYPLVAGGGLAGDFRCERMMVPILSLTLCLSFIFIFLKLDGHVGWTWFEVFAPLWTFKCLLVLFAIVLTLGSIICRGWMYGVSWWKEDMSAYCGIACGVFVFVLTPLLTFEVLLAQKLEGELDTTSYALIFTPLFVLEFSFCCFWCVVNFLIFRKI